MRDAVFAVSEWAAFGSIYYAHVAGAAFPFNLTQLWDSNISLWNEDTYMVWVMSYASTGYKKTSISYTGGFAAGHLSKPASSLVFHVTYRVKGKWKE